MNLVDRVMKRLRDILSAEIEGIEPVKRAIHIEHLFEQVRMWSYENYESGYLTNFYIDDDGGMWAIFDKAGHLYRATVTVTDGQVEMGELQEVVATYEQVGSQETEQRSFTLQRQADGSIRFSLIAATAVINRDGEIDSTTLFDNMIKRAEEMEIYPRVDFYHLGPLSPEWMEIGQVDVLAREGIAYIASGTLQADHPLTRAIMRAYEDGSENWGASIEYYPFTDSEEEIEVGDTTIKVYTDGINTRISILPEQHACSQFTALAVKRMTDMNERQKAALIKALGEDEAEKLIGAANLRTKEADEKGMVYRDVNTPEAVAPDKPEDAGTVEREIELDDEAIKAIADRVVELLKAGQPEAQPVAEVVEAVVELQRSIKGMEKNIVEIVDAVNELQEDDETKRRQWLSDLPREKYRITHRPRIERAQPEQEDDADGDEDLEVYEIAGNALATLGWK